MWKLLMMQQEKAGLDNYLDNVVDDDIKGPVLMDLLIHVEL
jgi:hypothetical protein